MTSSIEGTTILTPEDELAAQILLKLSQEYRQQLRAARAEAEVPSTLLLQEVSEAPKAKKSSKKLKCDEKQPNKRKHVEEDDSEKTMMLVQEGNQTELNPGEGVKIQPQPRKVVEEDDSEETLREILRWKRNIPETPPFLDGVGVCSQPVWKQLMESDVKEVYGRGGEVHKMMFKMWGVDTPVLKSPGWKTFVRDNELKMHCDFLTLWMFKHREGGHICFAIDFTTLPVENKLSWRITKVANQN
ncbi:unnamed protein product [Microthlaspi erraticum]|uniref:TF-B3 domain-containing protein n=1 Tax=Microthlaspi erraticum TaxID=1685480 RepID=A0A6D2IMT9_9BRAS|nr:unnamed protein product [Microthlaspi erraticum]